MRKGRRNKGCIVMATVLLAALLGGCSFLSKEADATEVSSEAETESPGATQESETETAETEETQESHEAAEDEESGEEETEDHFVEKKIVVATDMHYFAEKLAGNRCDSFVGMARGGDGRVLEYGWEVMDAFLDDMKKEDPDLLILSGDLTLDGEKASHEELAELLEGLSEAGIEVAVIPGNHDINNPDARRYTADGTEKVESITADEFRDIYADFGYVAADSRDPASLSYLYKIDSANWVLMLDSCQYEPKNEVGGMIRRETYEWMEPILEEAEREGARVISVSHHNLLDESGVSRTFYDNCTIEHNEELVRMLSDHGVRLHLSGHLHIQHYKEDEDTGIYEVVTGSMVMAPCHYGIVRIWNDGTYQYDAKSVDVDGWAIRHSYHNRDLADFTAYSESILRRAAIRDAIRDLNRHIEDRHAFFTDEKKREMASYYADLCVNYYEGRMYQIEEAAKENPVLEDWNKIGYVSELSDFLQNILEDEAKDYGHLKIPSVH